MVKRNKFKFTSEDLKERKIEIDPYEPQGFSFTKGPKLVQISDDELQNLATDLTPFSAMKIEKLPSNIREKFDSMVTYVIALYNTTSYKRFYTIVSDMFKKVKNVKPGTVGAYFVGCSTKVHGLPNMNCSLLSAGSMPLPKGTKGWKFCDQTVIKAECHDGKFTFATLHNGKDDQHSFVYVDFLSLASFPGFSTQEKIVLSNNGNGKIFLYGVKSEGKNYIPLTEGPTPLGNIKTRDKNTSCNKNQTKNVKKKLNNKSNNNNNENNTFLMIICFIIIIFIIYIVIRLFSRGRTNPRTVYIYNGAYQRPNQWVW